MKPTISLVLFLFASLSLARSQTVRTWTNGSGDGTWGTLGNWSATKPSSGQIAAFTTPGFTTVVHNNSSSFQGSLRFGTGSSFTILGTADVNRVDLILSTASAGYKVEVIDNGSYTIALSSLGAGAASDVSNAALGRLRFGTFSPTFDIASGGRLTLAGRYSSDDSKTPTLIKLGGGTLRLDPTTVNSGMNAQAQVDAGTLILNGGVNNVLSGVSSIAAGATVRLDSAGNNTVAGTTAYPALTGVRGITGTFDLNGFNTAVTRIEGTDPAGLITNGGGADATLTVGDYGTATGLAADLATTTFAGAITNGPTHRTALTVTSGTTPYTLALTGVSTYSGATVINGGTLDLRGGTIANTSAVTLSGSGGLRVGDGAALYQNLALPSLAQSGSSTIELDLGGGEADHLTLAGAYTCTGGSIALNVRAAPTQASYTLVAAASVSGTPAITLGGVLAGSRMSADVTTTATQVNVSFSGGPASLVWQGDDPGNPNRWDTGVTANFLNGAAADTFRTLDSVTFDDTAASFTPTVSGTLTPTAVTFNNHANNYTLGGTGIATGTLAKSGAASLTITGAHTFSGGATIADGQLLLGNASALGTGPLTLSGGWLSSSSTTGYTLANPVTLNGEVGIGDVTATGALTFSGAVTLAGDSSIDTPGPFTVSHTITGVVSDGDDSFKLTKTGANGVLALNAANTYDGGTAIDGGRINANNLSAFGSGPVAVAGGGQAYLIAAGSYTNPLSLAGQGPGETAGKLGALRLNSGAIVSANITLTDHTRITAYNSAATIAGNIGESAPGMALELGGFGLSSSGGAITITGNNTYSGGTEVSGAIVKVNSNTALGSGEVFLRIPSSPTYITRLDLGPDVTLANPLVLDSTAGTGTAAAVFSDAGDDTTASTAVVSGSIDVLQPVGTGAHFGARPLSASILRITGAIHSPNSTPVTIRLGTVELGGGGDYGALDHAAGTLRLIADQGISQAAVLTLGGSTTSGENSVLDLNGHHQTLAGLVKGTQGATVINDGTTSSTLTIDNPANAAFGGEFGFGNATLNLVKSGGGKLTLSGISSAFSGSALATAGTLEITGRLGGAASQTTIGSGARLAGEGTIGGALALGNVGFDLIGETTSSQLTVSGGLAVNGIVNVKLLNLPAVIGNIPVIAYSGAYSGSGGFVLEDSGNFRSPVFSTAAGMVSLSFGTPLDLVWTGTGGNTWGVGDSSTANWRNGASPARFYYADQVFFDDSVVADQNVSITGELLAGSVTFQNSTRAYTLSDGGSGLLRCANLTKSGTRTATIRTAIEITDTVTLNDGVLRFEPAGDMTQTIGGVIAGPGTLAKGGPGSLVISGANYTFTGRVVIANGSLAVENNGLGSGNIVFGDATTAATDVCTLMLNPGVTLAPPQVEVAPSCLDARITGTGGAITNTTITKQGIGTLTVGHPTDYTYSSAYVTGGSSLVIEQGTVAFSSLTPLATGTPVILGNANSGNDDTILEMPSAASADQLVLSPALTLGTLGAGSTSRAVVSYSGEGVTGGAPSFQGTVNLNGRDLYLENVSHLSGGTTRLYNFAAKISGTGNVHIRCGTNPDGTASGGPRCRLNNTANDWVGDFHLETGMVQLGNGGGGTYNAIPDSAVVYLSAGTSFDFGSNGDTFQGLVGGAATATVTTPSTIKVNVNGTTTYRMTLATAADSSATYVYDGGISDGNRTLNVTKSGGATQIFNGACTHTGATTVSGGKLVINGSYTSAITVAAGATLGGTMSSSAAITATAAGAKVAPGNSTGTMTAASANLGTGGVLEMEINDLSAPKCDKLVVTNSAAGSLNVTGATLDILVTGTPTQQVYVLAACPTGALTGTFGTVNMPAALAGYTLVYNYNDGVSSNNIALVGPVTDDSYGDWLAGYGALTGANRAPGADPDNDGLDNGIEFVIGSDPTAFTGPATPGYPAANVSGGHLIYTFKRSTASKAYPVTVETSTDLVTWPAAKAYQIPTADTAGPPVTVSGEIVTVTIPMAPDARKFARVKVDIPFESSYLGWLAGYPAMTGTDRAPGVDFDGDGLNNGVEFVIGSDPTAFTGPATPGYPTATVSGGNLIYTFKRSEASKAYPVTVETSTDLVTWPPANAYPIPTADTAGPPVTVSGETVTVTIPMAPDLRKFARVMTDIPFTP